MKNYSQPTFPAPFFILSTPLWGISCNEQIIFKENGNPFWKIYLLLLGLNVLNNIKFETHTTILVHYPAIITPRSTLFGPNANLHVNLAINDLNNNCLPWIVPRWLSCNVAKYTMFSNTKTLVTESHIFLSFSWLSLRIGRPLLK